VLLNEFFNNKISTVEEVENSYKIPVLGVIGSKTEKTNLVVFENPKSAISESYRALRSNVQFLLKRGAKSHIMLLTSSISGEGKTLTAMNLASVFALSGKKTILVGVDLRKPKIAEDFNMNNKIGFVHYLINQKTAEEVIQHTDYENLDILLSGPIPPNPSELLLSKETENMMGYLRENYEYIILDAPPIGAVSDAQELFRYADTILYLIRQGHTDKGLLKMIETKYKRKEVTNISYILNDFTFSKRHGYGYGYGGYGYGYGYYQKEKLPFYKRIFSKKS
jgi:capsular exopolysaccharide synthesis family protein